MLKFELSKLVDNISKYGKCVILIRTDKNNYQKLNMEIVGDKLNIDDESLLQILSLLYAETFIPAKFESNWTYFVKEPEEKNLDNKCEIKVFIELCQLIERILIYSNSFTESCDISATSIYESYKEYISEEKSTNISTITDYSGDYFDNILIPLAIKEQIKLRKTLLKSNEAHIECQNAMMLLKELSQFEGKIIDLAKIKEILAKYGYDSFSKETKENIDEYLKLFDDENKKNIRL